MPDSSSAKKQLPDQPQVFGAAAKSHRTKPISFRLSYTEFEQSPQTVSEDAIFQAKQAIVLYRCWNSPNKRGKEFEICVPIVYGNIAFWLGKKASEYLSHKWTVYVRGATNEDLGVVIKRVVFQLHSSFNNPTRVIEAPPFELSESEWGEFEITITLYFHNDICDKPLNLYHHLRLYPEDESSPLSTKKPVVTESYDEVVFPDPSDAFLSQVQNHLVVNIPRLSPGYTLPSPVPVEDIEKRKRGDTKNNPHVQFFTNFFEADELLKLATARQQKHEGQSTYCWGASSVVFIHE